MSDNVRRSTSRPATNYTSKSNPNVTEKNPAPSAKREVTTKLDDAKMDNLIRERAYLIWEKEGRPHGKDVEIWLRARKEVLAQLKKSS